MNTIKLTILLGFISFAAFGQKDTSKINNSAIFERIMKSVTEFKLDTSAVPDDAITNAIIELRNLNGGFNIHDAVNFKIGEEKQKNEVPASTMDSIAYFFNYGNGYRWLNNATIWIYRSHFSLEELNEMVRFYKTPAGQKLAADFPVIMLQTLKAAELIKEQMVK